MNLKEIVFFRAKANLDALQAARTLRGYTAQEIADLEADYLAVYQIIEEAELEAEFKAWKENN